MPKTIVNLTLSRVIEEVESVLDTYPDHPYQQAFAIPDLRQKLLAYILSRTRNLYAVVEKGAEPQAAPKCLYPLEHQLNIETLIRQGIHHILQEEADWVSHCIPAESDSVRAASHWFG